MPYMNIFKAMKICNFVQRTIKTRYINIFKAMKITKLHARNSCKLLFFSKV